MSLAELRQRGPHVAGGRHPEHRGYCSRSPEHADYLARASAHSVASADNDATRGPEQIERGALREAVAPWLNLPGSSLERSR